MNVVYIWLDGDTPFYVGIGKPSRAYSNRDRYCLNKKRKAEKNNSFSVKIIYTNLSWDQACYMECKLISEFGRLDLGTGCLTNMTNGGDGCSGYRHTSTAKQKISDFRSGNPLSQHHKEQISKGKKGKRKTAETKTKMSQRAKERGLGGKLHTQAVMTPLGKFETMKEASENLPFSYSTLQRYVQNENNLEFYYID